MTDLILFGVFPYIAVTLAVFGGVYRYAADRYSLSSQSSQFLESRMLFWGTVPWHFTVVPILLAHLLAFLFPTAWGSLLGRPLRLYLLEISGMSLGLVAVVAMVVFIVRRAINQRITTVTTVIDWFLLAVLLLQVASGVYIAVTLRWGSLWYLHTATPWLWSLVKLDPQVSYMAVMPAVVKVHAINAFFLLALLPFSRLIHMINVPLAYMGRSPQVVVWYRR
jgi:nitrate reductase gamma subunit